MQNDKIIAAIAEYLENADWSWRLPYNYTSQKIATEIAAAIAPLVEAGEDNEWKNAPEWAAWQTVDLDGSVSFWEEKPFTEGTIWNAEKGRVRSFEGRNWENSLQERPK